MALNKGNKNTPHQVQQVQLMQHIGPIPDPLTLEKYEEIQPGFAERIVAMAEKEQANRHLNDSKVFSNQETQHQRDTNTFRIGQVLALIAIILIIALCVYCAWLGYAKVGGAIACTVIVGVAVAFLAKKGDQPKSTPTT